MFEEMDKLNRRNFLAAAATATAACAVGCPFAHADDDDDDDDSDPPAALPPGPIDAGAAADYDKDGLYDKLAKEKQILLTRKDGKLYALTSVCTHKKFLVKVKDGQYYCPKHSSRFTPDGVPAPKPNGRIGAAKKPLTHYAISLDDNKHVIVDTSKRLDAAKAEEAGGFVNLGS
jgi:nitrite reductase/ring-hydroxylating ferredoxin subunit